MPMKEEYTAHDMATAAADGFRAGQRAAQSAGVPDGERLAELLESVRLGDDEAKPHGSGATYWNNAVLACQVAIRDALAAAPTVKAEQVQCNCPGGSKPDPSSHAPNCPVRNGEPSPALPVAGVEEVEVVAWQDAENPLYTTAERRVMHEWAGNQYPIVELMTVAQHNRIVAALFAQQSAHVSVPRELLEDLRDCANECYNHARFRGTSGLDNYERLTKEADALLNGGEA